MLILTLYVGLVVNAGLVLTDLGDTGRQIGPGRSGAA
jgi:hypothetical protein